MATYIDLATAKQHLRITDTAHDSDVQLKTNHAEALILDFIASGRSKWTDPTLPALASNEGLVVQAAILEMLVGLYEHRGDDFGVDLPDERLWQAVTRKLERLRDPAVA